MRNPTFCLIGAPRTGTTTMYTVLSAHPNIYMPALKEPFFFCDDLPGMSKVPDEEAYGRLFDGVTAEHTASGEASVWYLYSRAAPLRLQARNPDVKLLVGLRNPLEVIPSMHSINLFFGWEDEPDLETAIGLEGARLRGENLPPFSPNPHVLQYTHAVRFGEQLARWQSVFPADRFLVTVFDDFAQDPGAVYRRTLSFLGVSDDGRTSFPRANARRGYRSRRIGRLLRTPPRPIHLAGRAVRKAMRAIGIDDSTLLLKLTNANSGAAADAGLGPSLRAELSEKLAADVAQLSEMLDRDLSHWLRGDEPLPHGPGADDPPASGSTVRRS